MIVSSSLPFLLLPSIVVAVESLVKLDYTSYDGTTLPNGISQWLGVRYAAPPLEELRFAAPQDPIQNTTVQQAKKARIYENPLGLYMLTQYLSMD